MQLPLVGVSFETLSHFLVLSVCVYCLVILYCRTAQAGRIYFSSPRVYCLVALAMALVITLLAVDDGSGFWIGLFINEVP